MVFRQGNYIISSNITIVHKMNHAFTFLLYPLNQSIICLFINLYTAFLYSGNL
ncbi:hypothetical protein IGK61_001864 [Enterococcus sp. AZ063]